MKYSVVIAERHRTTLGLEPPFGHAELKAVYREKILRWHPDKHSNSSSDRKEATERAKRINLAYEFLSEFVEENGGIYRGIANGTSSRSSRRSTATEPRHAYKGKTYEVGFPDSSVTEIFVKSSNIVSTGYKRSTGTLYIKFTGNRVYRYYDVPEEVFSSFLDAHSHGKFAHREIFQRYRYERC